MTKKKRTIWTFSMIIVLSSASIFISKMLYDLSDMEESMINEAFKTQEKEIIAKLDLFFLPTRKTFETCIQKGRLGGFEQININKFNSNFVPILKESDLVSSIILANKNGDEIMALLNENSIINRRTEVENSIYYNTYYKWSIYEGMLSLQDIKEEINKYKSQERPWYIGASESSLGENYWTQPYNFHTTKAPGITLSRKWIDHKEDTFILAFDIQLKDISTITRNLKLDKHGKVFIISEDNKLLGCPDFPRYKNTDSLAKDLLSPLSLLPINLCRSISESMSMTGQNQFKIIVDGEKWICKIIEYKLDNTSLYIGQAALVEDFNLKLRSMKLLLVGGLILIILFLFSLFWAYKMQKKAYFNLQNKKEILEEYSEKLIIQHEEIQNSHQNTLDSLRYASRLQDAILPSKDILESMFSDSFILFQPRDGVSGDFYWFTENEHSYIVSVADCTGHGVPGALMSILGYSYLEQLTEEEQHLDPATILNGLRSKVVNTMKQFEDGAQKDGMDIALLSIDKSLKHAIYTGAHHPLYIVRGGELTVVKGSPMGISFELHRTTSFRNHEIQLQANDNLYIFSDGFVDQFGGPNNKKYLSSRFREFLLSVQHLSMSQQKEALLQELEGWKNTQEQIDDVCIIGLRIT